MSDEEWRPVPSAPGYWASDKGRIKGLKGGIMKFVVGWGGYAQLHVSVSGSRRISKVARLVCEAFHGAPPSADHEAAHADGDRLNDAPSNLRWATRSENAQDKRAHGTYPSGERHPSAKLDRAAVAEIKAIYEANSGYRIRRGMRQELADRFGVSVRAIRNAAAGRTWVGGDGW